jgi:hypothetical protein
MARIDITRSMARVTKSPSPHHLTGGPGDHRGEGGGQLHAPFRIRLDLWMNVNLVLPPLHRSAESILAQPLVLSVWPVTRHFVRNNDF